MSTARLNQQARDLIRHELIRHRFDAGRKALQKEESELAVRVYEMTYTQEQRDWMAAAPEGALVMDDHIVVALNGQYNSFYFPIVEEEKGNPDSRDWRGAVYEHRPVFVNRTYNRSLMLSAVPSPQNKGPKLELAQAIEDYRNRQAAFSKEVREANAKVAHALSQFRTYKALLKEWPEAESVIKKVMTRLGATEMDAGRTLPVVQLSELNTLLDLPPEETSEDLG
jgi:hypothetical protein